MKKILGIVVLGFLLSGCTTGDALISKGKIYKGMSKKNLCVVLLGSPMPGDAAAPSEDACIATGKSKWFPESNEEIIWGSSGSIYYVLENVTIPLRPGGRRYGNGTLKNWTYTYNLALKLTTPNIVKKN